MTYAHFDTFLEEFRNISGGLGVKLDNMSDRLTQVQIKVSGVDKDIGTIQMQTQHLMKRADSTSAVVKVLEEDRTVRMALQAQAETLGRPTRTIKDKITETITTALVLGSLAIGYNVVRDSMVKEVAAPAAPASPAPAHTPHTP